MVHFGDGSFEKNFRRPIGEDDGIIEVDMLGP
jgi:hypothetical protein